MSTVASIPRSKRRFTVPASFGKRQNPEVVIAQPMSQAEKSAFVRCEGIIEKGLQTFVEVGEALVTIRDQRLYREKHATFELYCRTRWDISKTQANRLIAAFSVVKNLTAAHLAKPAELRESVVRPLTSLSPAAQKSVWKKVTAKAGGSEHVTAADVAKAVPTASGGRKTQARGSRPATVAKNEVIRAIEAEFRKHSDWPKGILPVLRKAVKAL